MTFIMAPTAMSPIGTFFVFLAMLCSVWNVDASEAESPEECRPQVHSQQEEM
jgi:hypothetical protein